MNERASVAAPPPSSQLHRALQTATQTLLAELGPGGVWSGELSSSALSTATAVTALAAVDPIAHEPLISGGLRWLAEHRNADGGWGDTIRSKSNISTTALCWAAFGAARADAAYPKIVAPAELWLCQASGGVGPKVDADALVPAIECRYGKDRTFSVPILMMCALAGRLEPGGWRRVQALPFELAALPHQLFAAARLPVVSYALPALIAIGQAIHHHAQSRNPLLRAVRALTRSTTLRLLAEIQPPNGGFLEATPLTSFVTMSLASMGEQRGLVARRGVEFLTASARPDGSWPIDTNLSTWVTTLSIKALGYQAGILTLEQRSRLRGWLLGQQYREVHPYTHAAPGAWAWTDLPGGVPDADDTPGALLALLELGAIEPATRRAGLDGVQWLLDLQNNDGGIPTFCRGWGALPFDRSSPDLTAHTLRAWSAWMPQMDPPLKARTARAIARALAFLTRSQRPDGSWIPLWFGNEHAANDENPVYGTTHVLIALRELKERGFSVSAASLATAAEWLVAQQAPDGSWGGIAGAPASIEETALALEALAGSQRVGSLDRGAAWLVRQVESGAWAVPSPIGFYFARLWYYERLYPLIFTVAALGRLVRLSALFTHP